MKHLLFLFLILSLLSTGCTDVLNETEFDDVRSSWHLSSDDLSIQGNSVVLSVSKEDALARGVSSEEYEQVSQSVDAINAGIISAFRNSVGTKASSEPIILGVGVLIGDLFNQGHASTGSIPITYGNSFAVYCSFSSGGYFAGGHGLSINHSGIHESEITYGDISVQFFYHHESGPVTINYNYHNTSVAQGQCAWAVLGYFYDED